MTQPLLESPLPNPSHRGKVRDVYDLGNRLLLVATDRVSAFDRVFPNGIPRKGEVLTRLSAWWFERIKDVVPNHYIAVLDESNADRYEVEIPPELYGRTTLVRKAERLGAECIARGFLSGNGWKSYQETRSISGLPLPPGLKESDDLGEALFTPSTKAEDGEHDELINFEQLVDLVGDERANAMRVRTLAVYNYGRTVARERGLIIADAKFEFGVLNEEVILIDEVLTPDSSRFWPAERYKPGGPQPSFDKQPIRDWLADSGWKEGDKLPEMPEEIVEASAQRYLDCYRMLTGKEL
jgi:phosphoribosylaminoimidazole-succinocarboxamide synthase